MLCKNHHTILPSQVIQGVEWELFYDLTIRQYFVSAHRNHFLKADEVCIAVDNDLDDTIESVLLFGSFEPDVVSQHSKLI